MEYLALSQLMKNKNYPGSILMSRKTKIAKSPAARAWLEAGKSLWEVKFIRKNN